MKAWKGLSTPCPSDAPRRNDRAACRKCATCTKRKRTVRKSPIPKRRSAKRGTGTPAIVHGPYRRSAAPNTARDSAAPTDARTSCSGCALTQSPGESGAARERPRHHRPGRRPARATLPAVRREVHEAQGLDDGGGRRGRGGARPPGRGAGRAAPLEEGGDTDERAGDGDRPPPPAPHLDDHHVVERVPRHAAGPLHPRRRDRRRRGRAHRALPRERGGRPEGPRGGPRCRPRRRPVAPGDAARRGLPPARGAVRGAGGPRHRPARLDREEARDPGLSPAGPRSRQARPSPPSRSASTRRRPRGRRCARPRSSPS